MKTKLTCLTCFAALFMLINSANAQPNYAINFDGTDDYTATASNLSAFNITSDITLELWVKINQQPVEYTRLIGKGDAINRTYGLWLINDGSLLFQMYGAAGSIELLSNSQLSLNTWYHIAATRIGNQISLYINGQLSSTTTYTYTPYSSSAPLQLGYGGLHNYFNGAMDEVRVWNVGRTQTEIRNNMFNKSLSNSTTGLVAYYQMNEGSGTNTANSSLNYTGLNSDLNNFSGSFWVNSPAQFASNAISFDGTDDYIDLGADITNLATADFTIECWLKTSGVTEGILVCEDGNGGWDPGEKAFYISSTGTPEFVGWGNGYITSTTTVNDGLWHHVAVVWDYAGSGTTGTGKIYIDGTDRTAICSYETNFGNLGTFRIGQPNYSEATDFFAGQLDEIRIWNTARTQVQIQSVLQNELTPPVAGLVSYYNFNQGIAGGNNSGLTTIIDQIGINHGTLRNAALTGTTSNFVLQHNVLVSLPVFWNSFTAQKKSNTVFLQWSIQPDLTVNDFNVQHSTDGIRWETLTTVPFAAGNPNATSFEYTHLTPAKSINYYRILSMSNEGKQQTSVVRKINMNGSSEVLNLLANPVTDGNIRLHIEQETIYPVRLFDASGKLAGSWKGKMGLNNFDVSRLGKGLYFLKINAETFKIIIQ